MTNTTKLMLLLIATLAILVGSTGLVSTSSLGQNSLSRGAKAQQKIDFESRFPIADYTDPEPTDSEQRSKRNSKANRFPKGRLDEKPGVTETLVVDGNGLRSIPALPVGASDVIIIGDVLSSKAYLSGAKTGIFSEFTLSIHEVLKATRSDSVLPGTNMIVEREGGRIRYPSGQVRWIRFADQGMPSVGRRHLLFLQRIEDSGIHMILTGYELRGGRAFPLDGVSAFEEHRTTKFAMYEGVEEILFLKTVRDLLK